jgi:SAM-dependent methyltransferase
MDPYTAARIVASVAPEIDDKPAYFRLHRYRFWQLLQALPEPAGQSVLEVGMNPGQFTRILVRAGYRVSGTDLFPAHRAELWQTLGVRAARLNLDEVADDELPYPDSSFDLLVFSEVIEHLRRSPLRALHLLTRLLRPGGLLVVSTPNELYLKSRLTTLGRMLVWRSPEAFAEFVRRNTLAGDEQYYTHERLYTLNELRWLVEQAGLRVERASFGNPWERVGIERERLWRHPARVAAKLSLYSATAALPAIRSMLLVVGRKRA